MRAHIVTRNFKKMLRRHRLNALRRRKRGELPTCAW